MKKLFPLLLLLLLVLFSCNTYTILNGRESIVEPVYDELKETKIRLINPEEEIQYETITLSLIPLGERTISDSILNRLSSSLPSSDILIFTGSDINKKNIITKLGKEVIELNGGLAIINNVEVQKSSENLITIKTKTKNKITIAIEDQKPSLPSGNDIATFLKLIDSREPLVLPHLAETLINLGDEEKEILFLSSVSPASSDWAGKTSQDYREERSFTTSEILTTLGWSDAYLTQNGREENNATRVSGKIKERMDFIYTKGLNVSSYFTLPLDGLNNMAVYAVIIL